MTTARELHGAHLGEEIRFPCRLDAKVHAVVTAELREVHHACTTGTVLVLTGPDSNGDQMEITVDEETEITILPEDPPF
jgi:hypothetical protein